MSNRSTERHFHLDTGGQPVPSWTGFFVGLGSLPFAFVLAFFFGWYLDGLRFPHGVILVASLFCFFGIPIGAYHAAFRFMGGSGPTPPGACNRCGYDLEGLSGGIGNTRCPECGHPISDSV